MTVPPTQGIPIDYASRSVAEAISLRDREWLTNQALGCGLIVATPVFIVLLELVERLDVGLAWGTWILYAYTLLPRVLVPIAIWSMARAGPAFTRSHPMPLIRCAMRVAALLLILWFATGMVLGLMPWAHLWLAWVTSTGVPLAATLLVWEFLRRIARHLGWETLTWSAAAAFWVWVALVIFHMAGWLTFSEVVRDEPLVIGFPRTLWPASRPIAPFGTSIVARAFPVLCQILTIALTVLMAFFLVRFWRLRAGLKTGSSAAQP